MLAGCYNFSREEFFQKDMYSGDIMKLPLAYAVIEFSRKYLLFIVKIKIATCLKPDIESSERGII